MLEDGWVVAMPFQIYICDGCGEIDYVEFVEGYWLCRYCRRTLEDDGEVELMDGTILRLEDLKDP
jgi:ribosomal protein L37AE/L43A